MAAADANLAAEIEEMYARVNALLERARAGDVAHLRSALPGTGVALWALQRRSQLALEQGDMAAWSLLRDMGARPVPPRRQLDPGPAAFFAASRGNWAPMAVLLRTLTATEQMTRALAMAREAGDEGSAAVMDSALVARWVRRLVDGGVLSDWQDIREGNEGQPLPLAQQPAHVRDLVLQQAAKAPSLVSVQYALAAGADPRFQSSTALALAVQSDDAAMVREVLAAGARPTDALVYATGLGGGVEAMPALAAAGANLDAYGGAALALAAVLRNTDAVAELLRLGADPAAGDSEPLWAALHSGKTTEDIVAMLVEGGARPDARDGAMLVAAARCGNAVIVADMLELGVPASVSDSAALRAAVAGQHEEVVRLLLEGGADAAAGFSGALVEAARVSSTPAEARTDIAALLLGTGAAPGAQGSSAVTLAAAQGNYNMVSRLLLAEPVSAAPVPAALYAAAQRGHLRAVRLLLHHRSSRGALTPEELQDALARAALGGHAATVGLLRAWGAVPPSTLPGELDGYETPGVLEALRGAPGFEDGAVA